jgi:hypothetical protein
MELSGIQKFLEAYRKRLNLADDDRTETIAVIARVSGVTLTVGDIAVNKGVLSVRADSVTRNQLFLYKTKLLEEFKKVGKPIFDIY